MPEEKKARAPTVQRLRADETDRFFALYACLQELEHAKNSMEKRFRLIPHGWRDISMLHSVLSKLIDSVMDTIPPEKLVSLRRNMQYMAYRVYFARPVTLPADELIVKGDDLQTLIKYAHNYSCTACDSDCNKCQLGKALDHTMIQSRKYNESWSWIDCESDYEDKDAMPID